MSQNISPAQEKLNKFNEKFNDETYPLYPFVSDHRITKLEKGLYRKHKASFRGVTAVYDEKKQEYVFPLYGMYNIPEDIVIVPPTVDLNSTKSTLLDSFIKAGYKQVSEPPHFETVYFSPESEVAKIALENKTVFENAKRNDA